MINTGVDEIQLYFGDDYVVNDQITIRQPLLGDIIACGEAAYFSMVHTLTAIPSDMKSQLFDIGIDWMEIQDFDLFCMLSQTLTPDKTGILFGDLDFSKLRPFKNKEGNVVLADKEAGIIIDEDIYSSIVGYLRKLHNITPKVERAKNQITKQVLIDDDRRKIAANKNKPFKSYLMPLISAVKVRQGYTRDYIRNMGFYEFFDDVARLQIINNADHLLSSVYSGNIDMKKLKKEELNWMREI